MKFALLQLNYTVGDLAQNAGRILSAMERQAGQGVDLFITSELSLTGYPPRDLLLSSQFLRQCQQALENLAERAQHLPPVLVGAPHVQPGSSGRGLYNAAFWLEGGKIRQVFEKKLLPNYDVFDEARYFDSAQQCGTMEFKGRKLGITLCEDIWNEQPQGRPLYAANPVEELRQEGVDLLINLSASPFSLGKEAQRRDLLARVARRSQAPLLYVNQVGGNDDLIFDGNSAAYTKEGALICQAQSFAEDCLFYEWGESAQPAPPLRNPEANLLDALVLGLKDYLHKSGFTKAALGLSGGVDSALVAVLAARALGPENVTAWMMPSPYSSDHSISDSVALAQNLGIQLAQVPIGPLMETYAQTLAPVLGPIQGSLTEENLQARIRGNLLMSLSNRTGALLLTTGNKSELSVGYCTIYGDMAGGLAVISDLPKTWVYRLCEWINQTQGAPIPQNILTKAPSAELRPNQTDQDSLPEYAELDEILRLHIEAHQSLPEIVAQGFHEATVAKVLRLVALSEFKRKQAAPGLKVTDQAFGQGWRMPIVAKRL